MTVEYNIRLSSFFFFFSSRRRHTRSTRDWSSDVCSSDLPARAAVCAVSTGGISVLSPIFSNNATLLRFPFLYSVSIRHATIAGSLCNEKNIEKALARRWRSEERRVGKSVDMGGRRRKKES